MPKSFELGKLKLSFKEPRVVMRTLIALLALANVAAAVVAFKPFGGSADDMRQEQADLARQLAQLERNVEASRKQVANVDIARREGGEFLTKYVADGRTVSSSLVEELNRLSKQAGIKALPTGIQVEPVEGSESLETATISAAYEGGYPSLKKFIELVDKSPRFLIIENMQVSSPQQQNGQVVNVIMKVDTFVKKSEGEAE
jgi:Tfp pilus assembly protein PilO